MATYIQVGSGGLYSNGSAIIAAKFVSYIASGGLYSNGHASTIYPTYVTSGGLYGNGNVGGVGANNITLEYDTYFIPARPTIVFQVSLFNNQTLNSYPQPDSLTNLASLQQATTINIPGVLTPLQNGTQFTLNGSLALQVKSSYASVLTVVSIS